MVSTSRHGMADSLPHCRICGISAPRRKTFCLTAVYTPKQQNGDKFCGVYMPNDIGKSARHGRQFCRIADFAAFRHGEAEGFAVYP